MKVPGGSSNDKGFDKYQPKTITTAEAEEQSRLTKEQLEEIAKWRSMSADQRKALMAKLVNEIDGDGKCESSSKSCPSSGTTGQSSNSGPTKVASSTDAASPGSTRWLIGEIVKLLVSLPSGDLSTEDECALITVHVLLRTIQVREGFSQSGGTTTVTANVAKDSANRPTDGDKSKNDGSSYSKK